MPDTAATTPIINLAAAMMPIPDMAAIMAVATPTMPTTLGTN